MDDPYKLSPTESHKKYLFYSNIVTVVNLRIVTVLSEVMMRTISCSLLLMQLELSLPWRHFIAVVPVLSSMSSVFISDGTMSPTVRNSESYISSTSSFIINDDEALVDIKSPSASTWKYQGSYSPDQMPPSDRDNQLVQMAFKDFDAKRFEASDKEFTIAIAQWRKLHRPRDEIVSLLKAR